MVAKVPPDLKVVAPFAIIFSRGLSALDHWLMFSFCLFFISRIESVCILFISTTERQFFLFIEVLAESLKLVSSQYTAFPPGTPESRSVSDKLDERGSDGIDADA